MIIADTSSRLSIDVFGFKNISDIDFSTLLCGAVAGDFKSPSSGVASH